MINRPRLIGPTNFELWTGRLLIDPSIDTKTVQNEVTNYVTKSRITVVGYHSRDPSSLTMLRWPDGREGYRSPTPPECSIALRALAARLDARRLETGIVPDNKIHVMMGRNMDGYEAGVVAPIGELRAAFPRGSVTEAHMVSARTTASEVDVHGEPVGIVVAPHSYVERVHSVGDDLRQHHYAIEHGPQNSMPGRTDFFETRWSPTYRSEDS